MEKVTASLDQLSVHVTSLVGGMNELRNLTRVVIQSIERLEQSIERLEQAMERQNQTLVGHLQLAQQQSVTVADLTRLVVTQAAMVDRLLADKIGGKNEHP